MSARSATGPATTGPRTAVTVLGLVAVAVAMMLLLRAQPATQPFDPRSDSSSGTRGLVVLLRQQGATVDVVHRSPDPGDDRRVLVLQDRLDDAQRADLLAFADAGGVVVMADPGSALVPDLQISSTVGTGELPAVRDLAAEVVVPVSECDVPALQHLRGVFVLHGVLFRHGEAMRHCFGADGSFVVVRRQGAGLVVQLGDNQLFTNRLLRYADNGGLATALLVPAAGAKISIFVGDGAAPAAPAGDGTDRGGRHLADLVRPGVWMALAQLAFAFVLFAVARAVRPGRPVHEPEQVPIAGSELVVATGVLMQRARHASRAGSLLRFQVHRALCQRHHLPTSSTVVELAATIAERSSVPPDVVVEVLLRDVHDDAELLRLANDLHDLQTRTAPEGAPS